MNVLLYAFRADAERHQEYRAWLEERLNADESFGVSELVLSGFVRVVTNSRVFRDPDPPATAFVYADNIRSRSNAVLVAPGARHWEIFRRLCERTPARGNLVPDAYFAALAIESACEWITTDRDYARFPGLRWRHPLD